jgi:putative N-acetylmannosamine-6-phosphate epimerase
MEKQNCTPTNYVQGKYISMNKGIIVSIQGYKIDTTVELAHYAMKGGAVAIRTDQPISSRTPGVPIIGLRKRDVIDKTKEAYITTTINDVNKVGETANIIAIDYRRINENLQGIQWACDYYKAPVVADIRDMYDYEYIKIKNYYYTYISTTFSVFDNPEGNIELIENLNLAGEKNIIAEGGFSDPEKIKAAFAAGANWVCIGAAISDIQKLTERYSQCIV